MNENEKKYLIKNKLTEGKGIIQSTEEITNLINSQKLFKEQGREIKKQTTKLNKQNKEIEKLKKKLSKKNKVKFLEGLGLKKEKKKLNVIKEHPIILEKTATILHLKRIMNLLNFSKPLTFSEISEDCGISKIQTKSGISFLIKHNLIRKKREKYTKGEVKI